VDFYKDNEEIRSQADAELSVDHASKSDEGSYMCKAWWWWDSGDSAEVRVSVRGRSTELPKAVLTQESEWIQIYESESVTLRCQVPGNYTEWRFTWYNAGTNGPVTQDYYISTDGDSYTISSAAQHHSGDYACRGGRRGNPSYSTISNSLTLIVSEGRPKPALSREGRGGEIFEEDTVTLNCSVQPYSSGWSYLWFKDRQGAPVYQTDSSSGTGAGYTISAAALSHSGEYRCLARRGRNTFYSQYSDPIWVNVTGE
ncbi:low affinity immunoglobulin gamma Fc region receptor III-A-like isoform X1, partial [Acipenser oxyrinchus oxyrinchus]